MLLLALFACAEAPLIHLEQPGCDFEQAPALLSETGCMDPLQPWLPSSGLLPYDLAVPFWSDGAVKSRWLDVPAPAEVDGDGDLHFAVGSVLIKQFEREGAVLETRLLVHEPEGWRGYSYAWDTDQDDATLLDGAQSEIGWPDQAAPWTFPSRDACLQCHTEGAGFALGPELAQFEAEQLAWLTDQGLFTEQPVAPHGTLAAEGDADLASRARSWLHSNCANCHQPEVPQRIDLDLRFFVPLADTSTCDIPPELGDLGLTDARRIAPGAPERSVLWHRLAHREPEQMPPLASALVDQSGADTVAAWISALATCD